MTQKLLATDFATNYELPSDRVLFTDEAHFYLQGDVNNQSTQYCSNQNPRIIHEKPLTFFEDGRSVV